MKRFNNYVWQLVFAALFLGACRTPVSKNSGSGGDSSAAGTVWTTGVALFSFHRHPFVNALEMADSAGVKSVEGFSFYKLGKDFNDSAMSELSMEGIKKMKRILDDKGLVMESLYVEGAKNADGWKKFFDVAKMLGSKFLVCEPPKDQWDMIDSLAGQYGIKIAIHEHSKELSAYWHPDSVLAALKGHPNFGACADLGHWARSGLNPVDCLKALSGHILDVHLKDIDSLNNPKANDVNVGAGVIDFPLVVRELKAQHFDGAINVECEHDLDNNLPDVIQAIKYFNGLAEVSGK